MVWNCLVAASNLAAVFTCGERYEASILSGDPMAPSMAHPKCIPYLRQRGGGGGEELEERNKEGLWQTLTLSPART